MNRRDQWSNRADTLIGLAAYGFVGGAAFVLALVLLAAEVVGLVVLARLVAEVVS